MRGLIIFVMWLALTWALYFILTEAGLELKEIPAATESLIELITRKLS